MAISTVEVINKIYSNESRVSTAETRIEDLDQTASTSTNDISTINSDISNINADLEDISGELERIEGKVDDNAGSIDGHAARISSAESTISSHATRLTTAETNISSNTGRIQASESAIEALEGDVDDLNSSLQSTNDDVSALDSAVVKLTGNQTIAGQKTFTTTPVVGTLSAGNNSTSAASTAYVDRAVAGVVDSAPELLNTLKEVSTALGNDPNFSTTIMNEIGKKADTTSLTSHTSNTNNPHIVTKAQVGLGNVPNAISDAVNSDSSNQIASSKAVKTANDLAYTADTTAVKLTGNQTIQGIKTFSSTISGSVSGNAGTATKLQNTRTIGGVSFDGSANINLPGVNTQGNQNTTGNAASATKLQTARTIGGVSFDGTASINLPGVNTSGTQNTSGTAASATKVTHNVSTTNSTYPVLLSGTANATANQTVTPVFGSGIKANPSTSTITATTFSGALSGNAATATKLQTARNIQTKLDSTSAVSFNGTANVTPGVTGTLAIANGGTGATTAEAARTNLGAAADSAVVKLSGNQTIAGTKTFSSSPVVPTVSQTDDNTKAASTAYVRSAVRGRFSKTGGIITGMVVIDREIAPQFRIKLINQTVGEPRNGTNYDNCGLVDVVDRNNDLLGRYAAVIGANYVSSEITAYNITSEGKAVFSHIRTYVKLDGTTYATCPQTPANANWDQITTAAWVNTRTRGSNLVPMTSNAYTLGDASGLWKQLYAGTSSISTSDAREKQQIGAYPDAVLDAWGEVELRQFLFNDSVKEKGEAARIHSGMVAQQIMEVFAAHGLDATRYGFFCHDEWEAREPQYSEPEYSEPEYSEPVLDEDGNEIEPAKLIKDREVIREPELLVPGHDAGDRYALRYEECLCVEAAYQRRRAARAEERLAKLESLYTDIAARLDAMATARDI